MGRKLVIEGGDGQVGSVLEQVAADNEYQLQEKLKSYPELLPLDELGVPGKAMVIGRESALDSGNVDLVLLGSARDLALVEFKTGPQNPDFRACLAQLLDYGSDLWGMSLDDFEVRVFRPYVAKQGSSNGLPPDVSLDDLMAGPGTTDVQDAVDWRQRLQTQLRDGSFHYVVVAQRFTESCPSDTALPERDGPRSTILGGGANSLLGGRALGLRSPVRGGRTAGLRRRLSQDRSIRARRVPCEDHRRRLSTRVAGPLQRPV